MIVVLLATVSLIAVGAMGAVDEMNRVIKNESIPAQSKNEIKDSNKEIIINSSAENDTKIVNSTPEQKNSATPKLSSQPKEVLNKNYFDDAVFIGDSRTEGLRNYDGLGNATYYAIKGLMVNTAFTKPAVNLNGRKITVADALKENKFGKVYIMLGVNELGWSSFQTFINDYSKLIDHIKNNQPNSKIIIQSILPVSKKKSQSDRIYNKKNIDHYNTEIKKLAQSKGVNYLEVNKAVSDSEGFLPPNSSNDGIHLNNIYCKKWCEYLKDHTL